MILRIPDKNKIQVSKFLFKVFGRRKFKDVNLYFYTDKSSAITKILQISTKGAHYCGGLHFSYDDPVYITNVRNTRIKRKAFVLLKLEYIE